MYGIMKYSNNIIIRNTKWLYYQQTHFVNDLQT